MVTGTAEAASNAETTMTQLIQEYTIRAQVRALCKKKGIKIDRTEHVANSLGHLAAVVDQLNNLDHPLKVCLILSIYLDLHHSCMRILHALLLVSIIQFMSCEVLSNRIEVFEIGILPK